MAIAIVYKKVLGRTVMEATLLNGATSTGMGEWIDASGFHELTIDISGITTATVDIRCSNDLTRPSNATDGRQIEDVTSDSSVVIIFPIRWLKVRVSAYTSGTIYAQLYGNAPR
jgi:hypothetical protein